jgi:hypothetical protein
MKDVSPRRHKVHEVKKLICKTFVPFVVKTFFRDAVQSFSSEYYGISSCSLDGAQPIQDLPSLRVLRAFVVM